MATGFDIVASDNPVSGNHVYDSAPVAFNCAEALPQTVVSLLAITSGDGNMEIKTDAFSLQIPLPAVIVYVVDEAGEAFGFWI